MNTFPFPLIDSECANAFGVTIADLHSGTRVQPVADARQAAMWFADVDDNYTRHIADYWKCCPSNVRAAIKAANTKRTVDKKFAMRMDLVGECLAKKTCRPPEALMHRHD